MYDISDVVARIAEAKILEAIKNGEFDNLPGQGKPLQLEDLSLVPEDLRVGYILLKNAGLLPEELELNKEIVNLERLIDSCARDEEKVRLQLRLQNKVLKYRILMEKKQSRSRSRRPPRLGPGSQLPRF